jgi:hypothetical protein
MIFEIFESRGVGHLPGAWVCLDAPICSLTLAASYVSRLQSTITTSIWPRDLILNLI